MTWRRYLSAMMRKQFFNRCENLDPEFLRDQVIYARLPSMFESKVYSQGTRSVQTSPKSVTMT